jgi:hypothetical protein
MLRVLESAARSGDEELVVAEWQDLMHAVPTLDLNPALGARLAEILQRAGRPEGAQDTVGIALQRVTEETPVGVRVRLARLAAELNVSGASTLVQDVLTRADLPPEARTEMEALVASLPDDAPLEEEPEPGLAPEGADELDLDVGTEHTLQVMEAVPTELLDDVLTINVNGTSRRMALDKVEAVAVGGVKEEGRNLLVVDLMLDAPWSDREALRVVRLLSTAFDPRTLVDGPDALEAF